MTQGKYCRYLKQRDKDMEIEDLDTERGGPNLRTIRKLPQARELDGLYTCTLTGLECVAKHTYTSHVEGFKETIVLEKIQLRCPAYNIVQETRNILKRVSFERRKSELEDKFKEDKS